VLPLGGATLGRRVLEVATPHVPHNWESHVFYEQETATLFCDDPLTQVGDGPAVTDADLLDAAVAAEEPRTSSTRPHSARRSRKPTGGSPTSSRGRWRSCTAPPTDGDGAALLRAMADVFEQRIGASGVAGQPLPEHADLVAQ